MEISMKPRAEAALKSRGIWGYGRYNLGENRRNKKL